MADRNSYKTTLFDREGPDAGIRIKAYSYAGLAGVLSLFVFGVLAGMLGLPLPATIAMILVGPPLVVILVARLSLRAMESVGSGVRVVLEGGSSTPYVEQYSYQQALVMQGRLEEALESFEAIIAEPGSSVDVRIRAAELYIREARQHQRGAELLHEVLRHPACTPHVEAYAANRLADLLSNHLGQPGRALVQLRRLADRYPGTPVGNQAREAIRTLKALTHRDDERAQGQL